MRTARLASAALLASLLAARAAHAQDGPGLPNLSYDPAEVNTVIGHLGAENGSPRGHGSVAFHRGYLTVVFSRDSGEGDGGFAFYDVSNPKEPKLVFAKDDAETEDIREAHGWGFWGDYVVLQASYGVQFWDWSDVTNPKLVSYLKLPGIIASDYFAGAWWTFWQAPYVYVGGSQSGLFVLDAKDPKNPKIVDRGPDKPNPIPVVNLGGFRVGPVFAVGNTLAISGMDDPGYAMLDMSDPENPLLLRSQRIGMPKVYSALFNGGRLYGAGDNKRVHVHDVSDPFQILAVGQSGDMGDKGGYLSVQDGFVHCGASKNYAKVDVSVPAPFPVVATATSGVPGRDEDFGTVLGNLVAISDDHGNGSFLVPHQAAPDTTPPAVNFVSPPNGATGVAVTSRVGFTFTDQIDHRLASTEAVTVRPVGGAALPGRFSYQTNILNFAPDDPLLPNTTYEVTLAKGGLADLAGNALPEAFVSYFSTGAKVDNPLCQVTTSGPSEHGKEASFSVTAAAGADITYSWDFGDGTPPTTPAASSSVKHVFKDPGHYTVNVFVRSDAGLVTACALGQTVHRPLPAARPTRSSTVVADGDDAWVAVSDVDSGSVFLVPRVDGALASDFPVHLLTVDGGRPRSIAFSGDRDLWIALEGLDQVLAVPVHEDRKRHAISFPRGARPFGVVFSPDRSVAYVSLLGRGEVVEINPASHTVERILAVGPTPRGLAVSADGKRLLVTRFLSPDERGEVIEVDTESFTVKGTFALEHDNVVDNESNGSGLLNYLRSVTISPDDAFAWVPAKKDNFLRGAWKNGAPLNFENTVRSSVAAIDLVAGMENTDMRLDLNDRSLPSAVEVSPLGDYVFVATEGTNTVEVIDAYSPHLVAGVHDVGKAPDGLAVHPSGKTLYVHSFLSRTLHVIDVSALAEGTGTQIQELAAIPLVLPDPSDMGVVKEPLSPEVLLGKQIFYDAKDRRMARDGYLSCAVCHLDGEHDGRTWDFTERGEGLRNTTTLVGKRGTGQGRLHWTANFDEVQDFEHDIRNAFLGRGFLPDDVFHEGDHDRTLGAPKAGLSPELDALAAYLATLKEVPPSPYREWDGSYTADALAGEDIFERLRCAECHSGPDFTDSAAGELHDVGTLWAGSGARLGEPLTGLDTPTLLGLWATAPYLHDGSALTLEEVLDRAAAPESEGKHGDVASLSAKEKKQLARYLLELDGTEPPPEMTAGPECGCRVTGSPASGGPLAAAVLALLAGLRRRRRG